MKKLLSYKLIRNSVSKPLGLQPIAAVFALFFAFNGSLLAEAEEQPQSIESPSNFVIGPVLGMALTFGGDEISREEIDTIFSGTDSESIDAGELIYFYGGVHVTRKNLQLQATLGYQADTINGSNGDTGFCRYPLEVIAFATFEKYRVGAGVSRHLNPEYERDVDGDPELNADFKDATGFVIQADYLIGDLGNGTAAVGLRYTDIEYEAEGANFDIVPGAKFDGSNIGINFSYLF